MANPEHLEILNQGVEVWNKWRDLLPEIEPDLREADLQNRDLSEMDLSSVVLIGAYLYGAFLVGADMRKAVLEFADMRDARCYAANLEGASLQGVNLHEADLSGVILRDAYLVEASLEYATFDNTLVAGCDFSNATILGTKFLNTDLSTAKGLNLVRHRGPSSIDVNTLYSSGGKIPEPFLRGCGIPNSFIKQIPSLVVTIKPFQSYSCFISYSHKDEEFARQLYSKMRANDLRVWYAPEEMKGGQKLHDQIFSAIQVHDKLLLVLSENSLRSEWVATEIRRARKTEREENRRKLFPIRLVDFDTLRKWECFDADSGKDLGVELREYFVPDFSDWKDHDAFEAAFNKLLRALKSEETNKPLPAIQDDLHQRAILSPRQTLIDEWDKVESSIVEIAKRNGLTKAGEIVDCSRLINQLFEAEKITKDTREEFFNLSHIHNNIAFNDFSSVEPGMAIHFAERAGELQKAFEIPQ